MLGPLLATGSRQRFGPVSRDPRFDSLRICERLAQIARETVPVSAFDGAQIQYPAEIPMVLEPRLDSG